jgi:hypothetical protein
MPIVAALRMFTSSNENVDEKSHVFSMANLLCAGANNREKEAPYASFG